MTRYGMAIDLARCIGCHTCAIACKMANNLPKDVHYNRINTVGGDSMDTAHRVDAVVVLSLIHI